jgi:hypothetical protein
MGVLGGNDLRQNVQWACVLGAGCTSCVPHAATHERRERALVRHYAGSPHFAKHNECFVETTSAAKAFEKCSIGYLAAVTRVKNARENSTGKRHLVGDGAEGLKGMPVVQRAVDFAAADARIDDV